MDPKIIIGILTHDRIVPVIIYSVRSLKVAVAKFSCLKDQESHFAHKFNVILIRKYFANYVKKSYRPSKRISYETNLSYQ